VQDDTRFKSMTKTNRDWIWKNRPKILR